MVVSQLLGSSVPKLILSPNTWLHLSRRLPVNFRCLKTRAEIQLLDSMVQGVSRENMASLQSQLQFHQWHISSPVTMGVYRSAIRQVVRPGDVFLDLGAGTGILSYQACAAGAARVYAVEYSDIVDLLPQFAAENGFADRIIVRKSRSFDVQLLEKADVMVASMLDSFGIDNNLLAVVLDAARRLLKPGGAIIPRAVQLSYCPVELPDWYHRNVDCWNQLHLGFSFRSGRALAANQTGSAKITKKSLLAVPQSFDEIVLAEVVTPKAANRNNFRIERPGVFHALAGWFRATMAEDIFCSNSPLDPAPLPWNLFLMPLDKPAVVATGDRVEASVRADTIARGMIWSWEVRLYSPDGALKAEFQHSTFKGLFLGGLRQRSSRFVPNLSERGHAERAVLELCDGKRSLAEIAQAILPRFSGMFKTPLQAHEFAADVLRDPATEVDAPPCAD
jgi:precorrin-6B methylase 2